MRKSFFSSVAVLFAAFVLASPAKGTDVIEQLGTHYQDHRLNLINYYHDALELSLRELRACKEQNGGACMPDDKLTYMIEEEGKRASELSIVCVYWLKNSFSGTDVDLNRWLEGPNKPCNLERVSKDLAALTVSSEATRWSGKTKSLQDQLMIDLARKFDTPLASRYRRYANSMGTMQHFDFITLVFGRNTVPREPQGAAMRQAMADGAARPSQRPPVRTARNDVPQRSAAAQQYNRRNRRAGSRTGTQSVVDRQLAGQRQRTNEAVGSVGGIMGGLVANAAKPREKSFIVPGKATFHGFVFQDTPSAAGIASYRKDVFGKLSQGTLVHPSGVTKEWSQKTRDSRVTIDCWDYFPIGPSRPTRRTCLYSAGGKIIGGLFPSNEYDKVSLDYLEEQGFRMTRSLGAKELGYAMLQHRYSKGDMEVFYKRYNSRYDAKLTYYDSDFCFFPTRYKASLGNEFTCRLEPR